MKDLIFQHPNGDYDCICCLLSETPDLHSLDGKRCDYTHFSCPGEKRIFEKLAMYEKAEREGRLTILPFKKGDIVFLFNEMKGDISSVVVDYCAKDSFGNFRVGYLSEQGTSVFAIYGKNIFATYEDARDKYDSLCKYRKGDYVEYWKGLRGYIVGVYVSLIPSGVSYTIKPEGSRSKFDWHFGVSENKIKLLQKGEESCE